MKKGTALLAGLAWLALTITLAFADDTVIEMHYTVKDGMGKDIGTVTASQTPYGTLLTPKLSGLSPGLHGFHIHEKGSCGPGEKDDHIVPGLAAGGHYDPEGTGAHKGPYADGHLGDLPVLYVDKSGKAEQPMLAPRVKLSDLKGHALMIHANGDNYSDSPKKLGGGGARIACGVAK